MAKNIRKTVSPKQQKRNVSKQVTTNDPYLIFPSDKAFDNQQMTKEQIKGAEKLANDCFNFNSWFSR